MMQGSSTIESMEMETVSCAETICRNDTDKVCFDCKTSKTPLWRSGPAGPKSLCNACGIRYRKKKTVVGSSDKKREKHTASPPPPPTVSPSRSPTPTSSSSSTTACNAITFRNRGIEDDGGDLEMRNGDLRKKMRIKMVALGKEVRLLQRRRSPMKKVKRRRMEKEYRKFGEVEQAAFLLMSLSCGSVFA